MSIWLRATALAMAAATAPLFGAAAQDACAAAASCVTRMSGDCLQRFGAGRLDASDPLCGGQVRDYQSCLADATRACAAAKTRAAGGGSRDLGLGAESPPPPSARLDKTALLSQIWFWTCEGGNPATKYVKFHADGLAEYDYEKPFDFKYPNARWSMSGGMLILDHNQGFAIDRFFLEYLPDGALRGTPAHTRTCASVFMRPYGPTS